MDKTKLSKNKVKYNALFEVHLAMILLFIMFLNFLYLGLTISINNLFNSLWITYLNPLMYLIYLCLLKSVLIHEKAPAEVSLFNRLFLFSLVLLNIAVFIVSFNLRIVDVILNLLLVFIVFIFSGINIFKKY
ncbi:MAG: hypothetical protein PWP03_66 [Candidatus Woesearchaeota archaeon]|nr:hypothetical protein [Candidatus Woesearchaeota archaeon]